MLLGWAPASKTKIFGMARCAACVLWLHQVPGDNVPIQLNNKGFFAWFEPICKLYMLPKYNELDLTPFFAPFFMLFFGLCLGDSVTDCSCFSEQPVSSAGCKAKNISATMKPILSLIQVLAASILLRIADWYVLRSEYLRYQPAFLPKR